MENDGVKHDDNTDTVIGAPHHPSLQRDGEPDEDTVVRAGPPPLVEPRRGGRRDDRRNLDFAPPPPRSAAPYRFRVNSGAPIPLDSPVLIGRRPRVSTLANASQPRLVVVASPKQEVSATHLELHQHGASVIVTDMRSTNGTVVTMPGSPALTLRPGESLVAAPGTLVDIGDGNLVEILPVQRIVSRDQDEFERRSP